MCLKEILTQFSLEDDEQRKEIAGKDYFKVLQKPPQEFEKVAKAILSGYFLVENTATDDVRKVYPACVEIYYHKTDRQCKRAWQFLIDKHEK